MPFSQKTKKSLTVCGVFGDTHCGRTPGFYVTPLRNQILLLRVASVQPV